VLNLKSNQMLVVNPEYQRGSVWTPSQKKKLIDSVLRGYPIPLIYLHHIRQTAGKLVSERFEVIDGQQRINAVSDFYEGAFRLFDPEKDAEEARFPDFIKKQRCPWARSYFQELPEDIKKRFLETTLRTVRIETHDSNEARDLFVRLQSGMPLNSQEKRDAWPGQFTDFILRLGGKTGLARYPGHDFFNILMGAQRVQDRGKFRQFAAQIATLYFVRRAKGADAFCDINAGAIDDFYYENLGFDAGAPDAKRLYEIFDQITALLRDQKRSKIVGHEAIHLVLLVDSLVEDYTRSWEGSLAEAFDNFRYQFALGKKTQDDSNPSEYWLRYGVLTRVTSDRGDVIQRRHEFFSAKMREVLKPILKDPQRIHGSLERELIYYRDKKRCAVCGLEVAWPDMEIHHVEEHSKGGQTTLENGALVHKKDCHPKSAKATAEFAKKWRASNALAEPALASTDSDDDPPDEEDDENDSGAKLTG
jgi:Protein of unknown function DUF262/HNH endonuclease